MSEAAVYGRRVYDEESPSCICEPTFPRLTLSRTWPDARLAELGMDVCTSTLMESFLEPPTVTYSAGNMLTTCV